MTIRDQFKEKIKELTCPGLEEFDCTIGRVMQALKRKNIKKSKNIKKAEFYTISLRNTDGAIYFTGDYKLITYWKLTKENNQEATDEDQEDKTIKKLLDLLV